MTDKSFYITTAISYTNGSPHIGHAYEVIAADVMARFKRLDGYDVHFLTGTDEHGQKVHKTAGELGVEPSELASKISDEFIQMTKLLNISNDDFIKTTEERHKEVVANFWQKLEEAGDIYLDKYEGWYSIRDEAFYKEDETELNKDGVRVSIETQTEVDWMEEESYFFKLSKYEDKLLELYEKNPKFIQPSTRLNEVKSFVKGGLRDLSISRTSFDWGVKVPGNEKHVMYVWVDALTNYISALGYSTDNEDKYNKFWPADIHLIGKDILRFHAIYWPAFLMSADLPLPKQVFGHGFLNIGGEKMSKSIGNVVSPADMVEKYGLDQVRYFLLREVSFGNDGDFSHEQVVTRVNSDLANNLGNLAQRTLSMIYKNCEAKFPEIGEFNYDADYLDDSSKKLLKLASSDLLDKTKDHLENGRKLHNILSSIWEVLGEANLYVDEQAPWGLKKTDPEKMEQVLYVVAEVVRNISIHIQPFMPESANKMLDILKVPEDERMFSNLGGAFAVKQGLEIDKPQGVFPRYIEEEVAA